MIMKKSYYISAALLLVIIVAGLVYFKIIPFDNTVAVTPSPQQTASAIQALSFSERYENTDSHFSFSHPADTKIEENAVEGGTVIVVAHVPSQSIFQIYMRPTSEKYIDITADRLKADIPDLDFRDPREVIMGKDGKGLAFISKDSDPSSGGGDEKREVWFALGGFLYQLSAPLESDAFLQAVLNTWEFK
jgi:hypothetical protein